MKTLFYFNRLNRPHLALSLLRLQLLSLIFLGISGCVSTPPPHLSTLLPEGYYKFSCPIVYKNGFVELSHKDGLVHVQLLENFTGNFSFKVSDSGALEITKDNMDYPGLKRTFKGEGQIIRPGNAEGNAVVWLKSVGPVSRNHREGEWVLYAASAEETASFLRKQKALEARKARAEAASQRNTEPIPSPSKEDRAAGANQ
ncbi:hypothetical protein P0Y35_00075 [Kiritimatiellaeota bacterium B1221]|nr:hypothetical protein [Kiritimatiellaeota bacterium B1221]